MKREHQTKPKSEDKKQVRTEPKVTTRLSPAELARDIKATGRVIFSDQHATGPTDNATALKNINDTEAGSEAKRSSYGSAPGGSVMLSESMLGGMLALTDDYSFSVSEIAGGEHSANSRHYVGVAFDTTKINGVPVSSTNPNVAPFKQKATDLGATEVLGPGDPGHDTHVHTAWPRPARLKRKDDLGSAERAKNRKAVRK